MTGTAVIFTQDGVSSRAFESARNATHSLEAFAMLLKAADKISKSPEKRGGTVAGLAPVPHLEKLGDFQQGPDPLLLHNSTGQDNYNLARGDEYM